MWVYSAPLTTCIPAFAIKKFCGIPFIFGIHDMWPETLSVTGMVPEDGFIYRSMGALADRAYRAASAITVISPGFKKNLIGKGVTADKIHVIPNWANEEIYRPIPADSALAKKCGLEGKFNVIYGGNIGLAQAMDNVLEAACLLRDLRHVQLVFVGDGVDENRLRRETARRQLDNVRFLGRKPEKEMPYYLSLADVLLVHLKRDPLFEITIPSKIMTYLAMGRPVLCSVAGDAADVVVNAKAGLACYPEDPRALAETIRNLYFMPKDQLERMGRSGRVAFEAKYSVAALMDAYEDLFQRVVHQAVG